MKGRGIAMKTVGAAISEVDGGLGLLTQEEMYVWGHKLRSVNYFNNFKGSAVFFFYASVIPSPKPVAQPLYPPTLWPPTL
jgi:hypothetical protein